MFVRSEYPDVPMLGYCEFFYRARDLFDGNIGVNAVLVEQIDAVGPQPKLRGAAPHDLHRPLGIGEGQGLNFAVPAEVLNKSGSLTDDEWRQIASHPWMGVLSLFSVMVLGMATNWFAAGLLAFTIFFYAVVYTMWLKRTTAQNIVIGGAAGAFPPLIGWAAATGDVSALPLLLFAIIFLWTPPHFWALSLFVRSDYAAAGVPMLGYGQFVTALVNFLILAFVIYQLVRVATRMTGPAADAGPSEELLVLPESLAIGDVQIDVPETLDIADRAAFYDATSGQVYKLALAMAGAEEPAAHLCRIAYLRAWREARDFDPTRTSALNSPARPSACAAPRNS